MRRLRWLAVAALLLAATAALFALGEFEPAQPSRPPVQYPESFKAEEWKRRRVRETLAVPPATPAPSTTSPPPPRDPLLVALPVKPDAPVVIFEANALRHSLLGERFLACLEARKPGDLAQIQKDTGIDPLKDVDRVAFLEDAAVISGFFQNLHLDQLYEEGAEAYGDAGRLYHQENRPWLGTWRDQIVVLADSPDGIRRSIDQLEGRAPVPPSGLSEDMAYGEVYGVMPGTSARRLLGLDDQGIARRLAEIADRIELHVDAMQDVAAVVRVQGTDAQGLADLAKTMGAALAVARVKAKAEGDRETAELLEDADVRPGSSSFSLRLAVPATKLERWFEGCGGRAASSVPQPDGASATEDR